MPIRPSRAAAALLTIGSGLLVSPSPAAACSAFSLAEGKHLVVAKSYDWHVGAALVLVNKRRVAKRAIPARPSDKPAVWVSRYASITFNQYGREMPIGGMNERGLVVETLWLDRSRYPAPDERPTLTELQWVQYQLDLFESVAQVVRAARKTRIASVYGKVHYLVCDAAGACAVFENLAGRLVVISGERLVVKALTNDTYADSLRFLRQHRGFGGRRARPGGRASLARFTRVATRLTATPQGKRAIEARAFDILRGVSMGTYTKWNIVYLPRSLKVLYRTQRSFAMRSIDLGRFNPSCRTPVKMLDIDAKLAGDVTPRFADYTYARNRALLAESMAPIASQLPPGTLGRLARYPEHLVCASKSQPAPAPPRSRSRSFCDP